MAKNKILIVDDSVVFRSQIKKALEGIDGIEIVGSAANGEIALSLMKQKPVDIVILDLEMPDMNGQETMIKMKGLGFHPAVILFSSQSKSSASSTLEALNLGAWDFIAKPVLTPEDTDPSLVIRNQLLPRIRHLISREAKQAVVSNPITPKTEATSVAASQPKQVYLTKMIEAFRPDVIVIGSSTGGPNALDTIFRMLRPPITCPILIVQHMPPLFTASLAEQLSVASHLEVKEAKHREEINKNRVYIAPGGFHMTVAQENGTVRIMLDQSPERNSVRPAVDWLFESAAKVFGKKTMGFVLTGMGQDGKDGCVAIKNAGGGVMIQDQKSSIVFGMPGAVFEANAYDKMGNLQEIGKTLLALSTR